MSNILKFKDNLKEMSLEERRQRVDSIMMAFVEDIQNEIAQLDGAESFLKEPLARMQMKKAKNLLIDAAILSCSAISEEFDKH